MSKPSSTSAAIRLRGVRQNNLKGFNLDLPLRRLIVITGRSGSGKSSLAFDTLYAEGQRRYIETFSPYARQFFDRMDKPAVDRIEGIPPAIAIEQRNTVRTTRSTVGTMTEICDFMKVLWPHVAQLHCRGCGQPVRKDTPPRVWEAVRAAGATGAEVLITFDLPLSEKLSLAESLTLIARQGYLRLLVGHEVVRVEEAEAVLAAAAARPATLTVVQDRLTLTPGARARFIEACEQAYHFGHGRLTVRVRPARLASGPGGVPAAVLPFSNRLHCARCDLEYREPTPAMFSFNHPLGACRTCKGFGRIITIDYRLAIPDPSLTLAQGAVRPWRSGFSAECQRDLVKFCRARGVPLDVPFRELSPEHQRWVLEGDPDYGVDEEHEWPRAWYGVKGYFRWLETKAYKMHVRVLLSRYRAYTPCPDCGGARLQPDARLYLLPVAANGFTPEPPSRPAPSSAGPEPDRGPEERGSAEGDDASPPSAAETFPAPRERSVLHRTGGLRRLSLADFYALPVRDALAVISELAARWVPAEPRSPLATALAEVRARLAYLVEVGVGYLTLDRPTRTLSGGETERVNLAACLGTRLVNTLFVLDEPSVGLHPRDTDRLVRILQRLRDTGNTVVVVEHDPAVMRAADQIVDLGPGHGATGGEVVFQGSFRELRRRTASLTGQYLSGRRQIKIPQRRPVPHPKAETQKPEALRDSRPQTAPRETVVADSACGLASDAECRPADLRWLTVHHATRHNLRDLTISLPLGRFVCLTGVSGSGKTTLVREVLLPALRARLETAEADLARPPVKASDRLDTETGPDEDDPGGGLGPGGGGATAHLTGAEFLGRVVLVDQSPLGRTPRSNPAVYIGAFDQLREVFAESDAARQRGLRASAFSFNSAEGQCERCRGAGFEKIEMQFLSDVFIRCPECEGRRYRRHILEVKLRRPASGPESEARRSRANARRAAVPDPAVRRRTPPLPREWSISDFLDATVDEVVEFLRGLPESRAARRAVQRLQLLQEVGLGYLRAGQPINTLSGGESQRLKLVRHLAEALEPLQPEPEIRSAKSARPSFAAGEYAPNPGARVESRHGEAPAGAAGANPGSSSKPTLFLFDEPTTGLHFEDIRVLLQVFHRLVDAGHSVLVIEHNLDVIRCADWVIDLGPEAGEAGGRIVVEGTPEQVAQCAASHTGRYLRRPGATRSSAAEARAREVRDGAERVSPARRAIVIRGAREHNLKNLSLDIPRDRFVVITGVSGSGKSTLAFDLLFAEGQRRFLDSMNLYARQFVEQLPRPDVDLIAGIPPTVSLEQRTGRGGGKSTVATLTEIHHFLRLLYARLGQLHCPQCGLPVEPQTRDAVLARVRAELRRRGPLRLLAPVVRHRKGFHADVAEWAARHGYRALRADGRLHPTDQPFRLDRYREHDIEIVIGTARPGRRRGGDGPLRELVDRALEVGGGTLFAWDTRGHLSVHSTARACPRCAQSFPPLDPKNFSYNSAQGWCPRCRGFGELFYLPDAERGANADLIEETWWSWAGERTVCPDCQGARLNPLARAVRLPEGHRLLPDLNEPGEAKGAAARGGPTLVALAALDVRAARRFFRHLHFTGPRAAIARDILPEIHERLEFLEDVGLGYLPLNRGVPTLSGGENQRIRLAAQLGSNLSGVLYILDEPTIGLHPRDNEQLLAVLERLRARGNSVLVVEHDEATMRRADFLVDLGPGAGVHGGRVVATGTLAQVARHPESVTGQCLRQPRRFPSRGTRRPVAAPPFLPAHPAAGHVSNGTEHPTPATARTRACRQRSSPSPPATATPWLTLHGASRHNLHNLTVAFPLNRLVLVTGVSGSGKSTLVRECLVPALAAHLRAAGRPGRRAAADPPEPVRGLPGLSGYESLRAVHEVDQSPIGRTPRSIPATYVGFLDDIRALYAQVPEARMRGYTASRFSFNSPQGRCPECEGAGQIKLEMNFLPPAFVTCAVCRGTRFNPETLDIEYAGKNIAQVLDLSVEEALGVFERVPRIRRALEALRDMGLGYLKLGQPSPTLSGGEAQRVKLVTHLLGGLKPSPAGEGGGVARRDAPRARLLVLEEPTIGLHSADVRRLVEVLHRLVDAGHSVIVIEHNLELIAEADWVIDLGPEGGADGGRVVAEGPPEHIARNQRSHTGRFLRRLFGPCALSTVAGRHSRVGA